MKKVGNRIVIEGTERPRPTTPLPVYGPPPPPPTTVAPERKPIEVRKLLTKAGLKLDEAWKWAKKGLWLFCLTYTAEAIVLLELIDDEIMEQGQGLEPDEETTYTAIRTDIHNLMAQARRIGGTGSERESMSGPKKTAKSEEFKDLVDHLSERNFA